MFIEELSEYIDGSYSEFMAYQQIALDMLEELHAICVQHGITYYLAYGTLLGAVRDKCIIPWDYDIDVQIPYREKDKLIQAFKSIDKKYYINSPEFNEKCRHYFSRISLKGYNSSALHLDIFYTVGAPQKELKYRWLFMLIKWVFQARYYKLVNAKEESMGRRSTLCKLVAFKVLCGLIPLGILNLFYRLLCQACDYEQSEYFMTADSFGSKRFKKSLVQERVLQQFGDKRYYIPVGYEEILRELYGDYTKYPDIEARCNEFMKSLEKLRYFSRLEENKGSKKKGMG
ncbi:MAG: LicD family protein [Dehalococcoidales bacterium]